MESSIVVKTSQNALITGTKVYDRRDKLEGEGGVVPEPSRNLPPEVRTQYRLLQRLIRKSSKARAAISVADQEIIINVAVSMAMQRDLMAKRFAKNVDPMAVERMDKRLLKLGSDIRQGLDKLLLNPNARARVVVTDNSANGINPLLAFLSPPQ